MADPLGTIGIAPHVQSDMDLALGAGPDFLARLRQLAMREMLPPRRRPN